MPSGHVPSGHRTAKQALATVATVKVGSPNWLAQRVRARRPLSTGSPNGPLVLTRPTVP